MDKLVACLNLATRGEEARDLGNIREVAGRKLAPRDAVSPRPRIRAGREQRRRAIETCEGVMKALAHGEDLFPARRVAAGERGPGGPALDHERPTPGTQGCRDAEPFIGGQ